ncbi:TPA: penicillin-binding protein, partial [Bacillus thuringiensis]|nr:penicillin-binding protein [Bacillus thuringiensis]
MFPLTNFHLFYFTNLSALVIEIIHSLQGKGKLKLSQKFVLDMISPQGCSKWTGLGV